MLIVRNSRSYDAVDRMFDQLTSGWFGAPAARSRQLAPQVQADWHDGTLVLTVDLPGVPGEAVSVEMADRALTITVDHAGQEPGDRGELHWRRTLQLGGSLDADQVTARYVDGRLTVTVPPMAKPEPRRIAIDVTGQAPEQPAIEASAEG